MACTQMLTACVDEKSGPEGSLGKAHEVDAVQAYSWKLNKPAWKKLNELSLVLSSVYGKLI